MNNRFIHYMPYWEDIKTVLKFSTPIFLSRLIGLSGGLVSMLFIAQLGSKEMAAGAIISSMYNTLIMLLWGFLFPVSAIIAKNYGATKNELVGIVFRQGLILSTIICFPAGILFYFLPSILSFLWQPVELINLINQYFQGIFLGILPNMWLCVINHFLNGIFRPFIVTVATLLNTICTISLSYILLFGNLGFPKLGISGVSYAISIVYWLQLFCILPYLFFSKTFDGFYLFKNVKNDGLVFLNKIFQMGWPISLQYGAELGAFMALTFMMGFFGTHVLAAQQISLQSNIFAIIVPVALSQSATILTGNFWGRKHIAAARKYGFLNIGIGLILSFIISLFFILAPEKIINLYLDVNDPNRFKIEPLATTLQV